MSEHNAPFNTSPVKENYSLLSHSTVCLSVLYPSRVKRWRQKTKNGGRARYACALGLFAGRKEMPDTRRWRSGALTDFRGNEWQG